MDKTLQKRDDQIFGRMRSVERENRELRKKLEHARHYKEGAERLSAAVFYVLDSATAEQLAESIEELEFTYKIVMEKLNGH